MNLRIISEHALHEPLESTADRVAYRQWVAESHKEPPPEQPAPKKRLRLTDPEIVRQVWTTLEFFERDSINIAIAVRYFGLKHTAGQVAEHLRKSRRINISTKEVEGRIERLKARFARKAAEADD